MKKIIFVVFSLLAMLGTLSVSAQEDEYFLLSPTETIYDEFVFGTDAMRINTSLSNYRNLGHRYIVEFDIELPETDAKYELKLNHTTQSNSRGVSHYSQFIVKNGKWNLALPNIGSISDLNCNEQYHIKIAVDLKEHKQYCSISEADGTLVAYWHGKPFNESITADPDDLFSHDLRWGGDWADRTTETWKMARPDNVKIKTDSSYIIGAPDISFENGTVTASVKAYCNSATSVNTPVLFLCVYNQENSLVDMVASQTTIASDNNYSGKVNLSASKNITLSAGMKVRAMVFNNVADMLPCSEVAEWNYTE